MNSLNSGYVGPVIVPCNLNLALCYLKLSEGLILKNAQDKRKDQLLEKCVKVCDDVLKLWEMQKSQKQTGGKDKQFIDSIKACKAYVRKGKALEMQDRKSDAIDCYNKVIKIDPQNTLAKEALLKIWAKQDASSQVQNVKPIVETNTTTMPFPSWDQFKKSEGNSASISGDDDLPMISNRLPMGLNSNQRMQINMAEQQQEEMEELSGLKGALILIVRIIFDIIGGLFGYGTISPTYYNYM